MNLAILTLHYGYNEGAMLQAWCLARSLSNAMPEHALQAELFDHRYPHKQRMYGKPTTARKQAMTFFLERQLPLSTEHICDDSHIESFRRLDARYQGIVVGSDEVWRVDYSRAWLGLMVRQEGKWTPAFPNLYWPDSTISAPKASYAAANGDLCDYTTIPKHDRRRMHRILSDFVYLGVRDHKTLAYLEWLGKDLAERAEITPDPTFSHDVIGDVDRQQLRRRLERAGMDYSRPRLGLVMWEDVPEVDEAIAQLQAQEYQVVVLNGHHPRADISLSDLDLSPPEWAATFGEFNLCFSQRMHGCIFSLLNNTPLVGIEVHQNPLGHPTKMRDLLQQMQLLDFYHDCSATNPITLAERSERARTAWPEDAVRDRCTLMRQRSTDAIRRIVDLTAAAAPPELLLDHRQLT